jgi:hypothetical protein
MAIHTSQMNVMKNKTNISLEEIGRKMPFTVPEDYFEHFAAEMDAKIAKKPHSTRRHFLYRWSYAVAAVAGIVALSHSLYSFYQEKLPVNSEHYDAYVLYQVDESSMADYYMDETYQ